MGLIWTLILHYSISMPMWEDEDPAATKDQTPKQRLLDWIRSKIPEKNITNFTSDWNDGTAIAALVDAIGPGLFDRPSLCLSVCLYVDTSVISFVTTVYYVTARQRCYFTLHSTTLAP